MATEAELRKQVIISRQQVEQVKSQLLSAEKRAKIPPTKTQLLKQTREASIQRASAKKKTLAQVTKGRKAIIEFEKDVIKAEIQFLELDRKRAAAKAAADKERSDFAKAKEVVDAIGRGKAGAIFGLENERQREFFRQIRAGEKAFVERGKALKELGEGEFKVGIERLKEIQSIEKEVGKLSELDLETATPEIVSRLEKIGLVETVETPLKDLKVNIPKTGSGTRTTAVDVGGGKMQDLLIRFSEGEIVTTELLGKPVPQSERFIESQKEFKFEVGPSEFEKAIGKTLIRGEISKKIPTTFSEKVRSLGPATAIIELAGDIAAEAVKGKRLTTDIIKLALREKTKGFTLSTPKRKQLEKVITEIVLAPTSEARKRAEINAARFGGEIAVFLTPPGGILAVTSAFESIVTPGGKERIEQTKQFLESKNLPEQLAYIPTVLLAAGGAFQISAEIKAFNRLAALSTADDVIKTTVASPNVRRKTTTAILNTLDDDTRAVISSNKLTAGRVYTTTIGTGKNARTITFLEFGRGRLGTQGFEGSRQLFGVELSKDGKIISTIGGVSVEKTTEGGVSRSITNLLRTTQERGRFTITPKQKNQFFSFIEETKVKGVDIEPFSLRLGKGEVSLIKKTEKVSKLTPEELALKPGEAQKLRDFFEGKGPKFGEGITDTTSLAIEKFKAAEIKLLGQKVGDVTGIVVKTEIKGVEAGIIISKDVKLKAPSVGGITSDVRLASFRAKLSSSNKNKFDKLTKIDQLFLENQNRINLINKETGLSIKDVSQRLKLKDVSPIGGEKVTLKVTSPPSGVPGAIAKVITGLKPPVSKFGAIISKVSVFAGAELKPPVEITAQKLEQNILQVSNVGLKQALELKQELVSVQKVAQDPILKTAPQIKSALKVKQAIKQQLVIKQVLKPVTVPKTKPPIAPPIKIPKLIVPPIPLPSEDLKKVKQAFAEKKKTDGWIPEIKDRGKFKRFTKPFKTKAQADRFRDYVVDNSTSAQSRVKAVTGVKKFSKKILPPTSPLKFRVSKIVKGKIIPLPNSGKIERRKHRIDTTGEKQGLRAAKLLAQRFPKKKLLGIPLSKEKIGGSITLRKSKKINLKI